MLNLKLSIHFRYNLKLEIRLQGKYGEDFFVVLIYTVDLIFSSASLIQTDKWHNKYNAKSQY